MTYSPSLQDISSSVEAPSSASYLPSLEDLNKSSPVKTNKKVQTFLGELPEHTYLMPTKEEFMKAGEIALPFVAPPIRALPIISNVLSKIPGATSIGNALGRIGYGTALTTVPKAFTEEGRQNFPEILKENALLNTALEGASYPLGRAIRGTAELFNPIKYSRDLAKKIKMEHDASESVMTENYRPIKEKYGENLLSVTPEKYLKKAGINKNNLYPDAEKYYNDFVSAPTYSNLLNLKSQIGRDWAKISPTDTHVRDAQLFNRYKHTLDNKLKSFLSHDKNALSQYELANKYAENVYYPYLSTPTLKSIAKGKYDAVYPQKMAQSIEKATKRVVGQEYKYRIPESHALRGHLSKLQNRIALGDIAEIGLPTLVGMIGGEMLHPGLGGTLGGLGGGFGAGASARLMRSKLLEYPIVQSPTVENVFKKLAPVYYAGGRAIIGQQE